MEAVFAVVILCSTWWCAFNLHKLVVLLFNKQCQMLGQVFNQAGVTRLKVRLLALWTAMSLLVIGFAIGGVFAAYALAKNLVQEAVQDAVERQLSEAEEANDRAAESSVFSCNVHRSSGHRSRT